MLYSRNAFTQEIEISNFSCLSRGQKEQIAVCFEQNAECHKYIDRAVDHNERNLWEYVLLSALLGFVGGMAVSR